MVVSIFTALPFTAHAEVYTGYANHDKTAGYRLDTDTGELRFSGTGILGDGTSATSDFIAEHRKFITSVFVDEGVTSIGDAAFSELTNVKSVGIAASVSTIGNYAFAGCTALKTVNYTGTESQWIAITIADISVILQENNYGAASVEIV